MDFRLVGVSALALLLVLAGCVASAGSPTGSAAAANPWGKETVVIGVNATGTGYDHSRNYTGPIGAGVAYWTHDRVARYGDYPVNFTFDPGATHPDIEIRVVDSLYACGFQASTHGYRGCAPVLHASEAPADPVVVRVSATQTDRNLQTAVSHELGHVLGLGHQDEPAWLMSHGDGSGSVTDAKDRANPWGHSGAIRVAVRDDFANQYAVDHGVANAVTFYNAHRSTYLPPGTRFVLVDHWYEADIIFQNGPPPGGGSPTVVGQSAPTVYGRDWDNDPAMEMYTAAYIDLSGVPSNQVGWHAGYWLGRLTNNDDTHLPEQYR